MDSNQIEVRLVGGPPDWAGRTMRFPASPDPGAFLISDHTPTGRDPDTEDIDPRAVYLPDEDGDPAVWHFRGWFPASASDPPPEAYLEPGSTPPPT